MAAATFPHSYVPNSCVAEAQELSFRNVILEGVVMKLPTKLRSLVVTVLRSQFGLRRHPPQLMLPSVKIVVGLILQISFVVVLPFSTTRL
ncbi:hypothetical protein V6N11_018051 [Hibiscus sabdariffa]|uniref:Uncharacterized protein n=1 Tax=Hibiscus sabdariffa TaxID=183260 RepID=A0ABR2T681_9ROSI